MKERLIQEILKLQQQLGTLGIPIELIPQETLTGYDIPALTRLRETLTARLSGTPTATRYDEQYQYPTPPTTPTTQRTITPTPTTPPFTPSKIDWQKYGMAPPGVATTPKVNDQGQPVRQRDVGGGYFTWETQQDDGTWVRDVMNPGYYRWDEEQDTGEMNAYQKWNADFQERQFAAEQAARQQAQLMSQQELGSQNEAARLQAEQNAAELRLEQQRQLAEYRASPGDWIKAWEFQQGINQPQGYGQNAFESLGMRRAELNQWINMLQTDREAMMKTAGGPSAIPTQGQINQMSLVNPPPPGGGLRPEAEKYWGGGMSTITPPEYRKYEEIQAPNLGKMIESVENQIDQFEALETQLAKEQAAEAQYVQPYQRPKAPPAPQGTEWISKLVPGWTPGEEIPIGKQARLASAQLWNRVPWSQREMLGGYLGSQYQRGIPSLRDYEEMIASRLPRQSKLTRTRTARQR